MASILMLSFIVLMMVSCLGHEITSNIGFESVKTKKKKKMFSPVNSARLLRIFTAAQSVVAPVLKSVKGFPAAMDVFLCSRWNV